MCDRMLQDSLRCYMGAGRRVGRGEGLVGWGGAWIQAPGAGWGFGPRVRGGMGFGPRVRGVRGFGPGARACEVWRGEGLRGGRGEGWDGIRTPGAGCAGIRARGEGLRGVMGFGPRRGVEWGFRPRRGVEWGFGPRRGVGIIWGKMGNFLPFCRFFAVWVEICGNRKLVSLPFRRFFCCLGRDLWQPETGFSTLFASFSLFG